MATKALNWCSRKAGFLGIQSHSSARCRRYNIEKRALSYLIPKSSTATSENVANSLVTKNNPLLQTEEDLGLFTVIPSKDIRTNFAHGLPSTLAKLSEAIGEYAIMVRQPGLEVINSLQNEETLSNPKKFIFYGPDGSGKSVSLCHVIYYAMLKNWIILNIPCNHKFTKNQSPVQPSTWNIHRVDQPEVSSIWLKAFRTMNAHTLTRLKTKQDYNWGKREVTEKDSPLLDIVNQGLSRSTYSTDAIGVLLREIRMQTDYNVLVAIDEANVFYENTLIKGDKSFIDVEKLSLCHHFRKLLRPRFSLMNGAYVLALSRVSSQRETHMHWMYDQMLSEEHLDELGEVNPILVPNYNEQEMSNLYRYLQSKNWVHRELTQRVLHELKFLTAGNPRDINRLLLTL